MDYRSADTLVIDKDKCIGCGQCEKVCIRDTIKVVDRKATQVEGRCFACYQCVAVCPKGAIRPAAFPDYEGRPIGKQSPLTYEQAMDFLTWRRSCRWFTDKDVTREEFEKLFEAGHYSPTAMHDQGVEFAVVSERLDDFMQLVYEILKPIEDTLPRIHEFCQYQEGVYRNSKGHPFLWEGRQLVLAFSEVPVDAVIAMTRVELTAYTLGLGGFYSLFMNKAAEREPDRFSAFFKEIPPEKKLRCVFVIGHPRVVFKRTLPPRRLAVRYY